MRPLVAFCLVLFATGPVGAIPFEDARHLAARTGFGLATADEIAALGPLDYESAVDRLLDGVRRDAVTAPPEWVDEPGPDWRAIRTMDANARAAFFKSLRERRLPLKMWWFGEILRTDSPLTERMVLVRQANWQKVGGASPLERRSNRTTFLREPCVGSREGAGEASVAAWMGRAIEHRKSDGPGCRGFQIGRRQYRRRRFGEMSASPAVSENPCTFARLLLGPWEVFKLPLLS